jgi:hypothetical protein
MYTDSPLLQIFLTKFNAQNLLGALPPGEERRKLKNKIVACDVAINFLKANSESSRQLLASVPSFTPPARRPEPRFPEQRIA